MHVHVCVYATSDYLQKIKIEVKCYSDSYKTRNVLQSEIHLHYILRNYSKLFLYDYLFEYKDAKANVLS